MNKHKSEGERTMDKILIKQEVDDKLKERIVERLKTKRPGEHEIMYEEFDQLIEEGINKAIQHLLDYVNKRGSQAFSKGTFLTIERKLRPEDLLSIGVTLMESVKIPSLDRTLREEVKYWYFKASEDTKDALTRDLATKGASTSKPAKPLDDG